MPETKTTPAGVSAEAAGYAAGRVTGPEQRPPPHPFYGDSYERGRDPWHIDAFQRTGVEAEAEAHPEVNKGQRSGGWYLVDGWGNLIGWVPDGTPLDEAA